MDPGNPPFLTAAKSRGYAARGQLLFRGDPAQSPIRPLVSVAPEPAGSEVLNFLDRIEQPLPEPVVPHGAIVAFNVSILLRLSRLNMLDADAAFSGPDREAAAHVFRPVVAADDPGLVAPLNEL